MVEQLSGEVADDVYQTLVSWRRWNGLRLKALTRGDFAAWRRLGMLRHTGAELAFKKHQLGLSGTEQGLRAAIERYRVRLEELGAAAPPPA